MPVDILVRQGSAVFNGSTDHGPRSASSHWPLSLIIGQRLCRAIDVGHRPFSVVAPQHRRWSKPRVSSRAPCESGPRRRASRRIACASSTAPTSTGGRTSTHASKCRLEKTKQTGRRQTMTDDRRQNTTDNPVRCLGILLLTQYKFKD